MSLALSAAEFLVLQRWSWFQQGRFLGRVLDEWTYDSQEFIRTRLPRLVVIAIIAFILSRLLRLATSRMIHVSEKSGAGTVRRAEVRTMAGVIRATGLAIIAVIALLQALDSMGFNLAPLLASAGVAGIAIGLAAQNIVKDMFNGMLFLLEDQFNVGDTVRLAGLSGVVESMTLRKTMVRDGDGTLYVIPNSQITTVANLSADFSVATVNVSVDFSANPDEVTKLLKQIAMDVRNSAEFKSVFLQDPQVLGVDAVKGSQIIFPVVFKTLATQQYGPMREFQRRVRLALEQHHMLPGDPYRVFRPTEDSAASESAPSESVSPGQMPEEKNPAPEHDPTTIKSPESNPFTGE